MTRLQVAPRLRQVPRRFFDAYKMQPGFRECSQNFETSKNFKCSGGKGHIVGKNCFCNRLLVKAQMSSLDEAVGNITAALRLRSMWRNTFLLLIGDNGGPTKDAHPHTWDQT